MLMASSLSLASKATRDDGVSNIFERFPIGVAGEHESVSFKLIGVSVDDVVVKSTLLVLENILKHLKTERFPSCPRKFGWFTLTVQVTLQALKVFPNGPRTCFWIYCGFLFVN